MIKDYQPLLWRPEFMTGIQDIDEQHRILIDTLHEANAQLAKDASLPVLEKITQDLLGYALYHFDTEESLMHELGYMESEPEQAARHQEQHRLFSAKVLAVREDLKAGKLIEREVLLGFLSDWLENHILKTDQDMVASVRQNKGQNLSEGPIIT